MRYSSTILAALAAAPLLVSARPIKSRAASAADALVFQFANVLEQLETEFYKEGIAKFKDSDFQAAGFSSALIASQTLTTIQGDEATHTTVIQQALKDNGADPLQCKFKFDDALKDVPTMAATARAVEMVGVSAYLGGATLLDDPVLLDAAASILTVEARHQTLLNILSGASAIPAAFDIPLTPQEVLSIAGGFIDGSCDLGLTPTNPLTVTNALELKEGDLINVSAQNISGTDNLFCQMITGGAPFAMTFPLSQCNVPAGINGPVALWVTSDDNPLINNVIDRDTNTQVAGPAFIFIDSQPETLGQLVRSSGTNSGATTTETTTISTDEANSIIAGAQQTGSPTEGNGAAAPESTPLPKDFTGPSPDGKMTVNGLTFVPRPAASGSASASASSTDSSSASSTDSASASSTSSDSASASPTTSA